MSQKLQATIGNDAWMRANADKLRAALPTDWTPVDQTLMLRVGFAIKVAGVEWHSQEEFGRCMAFFEKTGLMERMGALTPESAVKIRRRIN
jgi:hypothetical protein